MRIVDRQTFLAMPAGTVFAKYRACVFGDLMIKGEASAGPDFYCQQIVDSIDALDSHGFVETLTRAERDGASGPEIAMNFNYEGRDGLFDKGQLFAVWSREDVEGLIERLVRARDDAATCGRGPHWLTAPTGYKLIGGPLEVTYWRDDKRNEWVCECVGRPGQGTSFGRGATQRQAHDDLVSGIMEISGGRGGTLFARREAD